MSDDEQQRPLVVWGIPVPRKSNGRNMWPAPIKAMAAERFMAGHTVAAIAREVTANESLVGKWIRDHKRADPDGAAPSGVFEVVGVVDEMESAPAAAVRTVTCDIHLGDVRLAVSPGYPAAHLAEILREVRASR